MNKKDYIIITFFFVIFAILLYQKKFGGAGAGSGDGSGSGSDSRSNESFANVMDGFNSRLQGMKEGKGTPPAGLNTKSFYDEKGDFKSYYEGEIPDEFLTKKENFTDPDKMEGDIHFKQGKMKWHQEAERIEFEKFHDIHGKDKQEYKELIRNQERILDQTKAKNLETWRQLRRERDNYHDSDLR